MKRPLEKITIKGYKSIRALEDFPLTSLNILIGANGSGKTNFISAFKLLNQIADEKLQLFVGQQGGAETFFHFGQKTTNQIALDLKFGENGYQCSLLPAAGDSLIFGDEVIAYFPYAYDTSIGKGQRETRLREEIQKKPDKMTIADYVLRALRSWRVYHFHDTSAAARVKQKGDINDNEVLRADASNLAAFLYFLREKKNAYYQKIVATIRQVAPFFEDFSLRPDPLNPEKIQLEWREVGSDAYFNAHLLSDGTLRFICLATLLLQPKLPSTILIDEPELGLHPYAIALLADLLKSAATETQVIVSTQSTSLVNKFDPEDIIVVDREDGQSTFKRLGAADLENWLDAYGMGDLWEKNLIGGRPA